ncbi:hypothetical protein GUJ93_ZPchr0007g5776 [Zizania palustris]|uniref:Uncharacterized protein n=1 Tax=Zizania palustris TaxID=103762 RepID=A0A8J5T748_ZIZPA|nr:hypothetical protein GUJ93_ZPchr0007g5776 [Zizania palustris]
MSTTGFFHSTRAGRPREASASGLRPLARACGVAAAEAAAGGASVERLRKRLGTGHPPLGIRLRRGCIQQADGKPSEPSWTMAVSVAEAWLRQEKVKKFEDFVDRRLKPDLVSTISQRDKLFQQQKTFLDLKRNIENLEKNGVTSMRSMVNLGSEVYMQAEV